MRRSFAIAAVLLLAGMVRAEGAVPGVRDGAKLFSRPAVERVAHVAEDIQKTFDIQLVVETMKTPPGLSPEKLRGSRSKDVIRALREAAQRRADELQLNGLLVLITTDPRHVTVVGWPAGREREWGLSDHKREQMRRYLARHLDKDADLALVRAVEEYRRQLGARLYPSPMDLVPALAVVAGLVGVWVLLTFVRARAARPAAPPPIYRPAMLGSLFGVPAGFWVHDQLFQQERPATPPPAAPPEGTALLPATSDNITRPPDAVRPAEEEAT